MNPTTPSEDGIPLTLSREDLYELAWSKPLRELAKDFGISDVALAKRCGRLGIPVPGRGYWARIDAGQRPYRPKLPSREPQSGDHSALIAGPSGVTPAEARAFRRDEEDTPSQHEVAAQDAAWLVEHVAFETGQRTKSKWCPRRANGTPPSERCARHSSGNPPQCVNLGRHTSNTRNGRTGGSGPNRIPAGGRGPMRSAEASGSGICTNPPPCESRSTRTNGPYRF